MDQINTRGLVSHLHHRHDYSYPEAQRIASEQTPSQAAGQNSLEKAGDNIENDELIDLYETMIAIRRFEDAVDELSEDGHVPGNPHLCIGQEAIAAGVCGALAQQDYIASTWRGHGHMIAKGVDIGLMLAEITGSEKGLNGGRAGTMHMADLSVGAIGQNGIVGASTAHVAGAALAAKLDDESRVGVAFFSDGALNEGILPETMNLAAIWDLPVLFVCENNHYAVSTPVEYSTANAENIPDRAEAMGIPGYSLDGQDAISVYETATEAIGRAREGGGPSFIECRTYRYSGHFSAEEDLLGDRSYRPEEEEEAWEDRDPIRILADKLLETELVDEAELEAIRSAIDDEIESAKEMAIQADFASGDEALDRVYADQNYANLPSPGYR